MSIKNRSLIVAAMMVPLSVTLISTVSAEDSTAWKGDTELGFVLTDGNTETRTVNGKLDLTDDGTKWRNNIHVEALNTSEAESTSAEKYLASLKTDYKFSGSDFVFTTTSYEDDRFNASGYDYQVTMAAGYGRTVIKSELHTLDLEVGPGYRYLPAVRIIPSSSLLPVALILL